jgi:hypothetical protein
MRSTVVVTNTIVVILNVLLIIVSYDEGIGCGLYSSIAEVAKVTGIVFSWVIVILPNKVLA